MNRGPSVSKYFINFSLLIEFFAGQYVADETIGPYFRSSIAMLVCSRFGTLFGFCLGLIVFFIMIAVRLCAVPGCFVSYVLYP